MFIIFTVFCRTSLFLEKFGKKEALGYKREVEKLERSIGGIKDMGSIPDIMFVIDTNKEQLAIKEANRLNIPVAAILGGQQSDALFVTARGAAMTRQMFWSLVKRHAQVADFVRKKISGMGLTLFSKAPSNGLTAIVMPSGVPSGDVIKHMRDNQQIVMADGQGDLQGKIVRFAHMGAAGNMKDAERGYNAFSEALKSGVVK